MTSHHPSTETVNADAGFSDAALRRIETLKGCYQHPQAVLLEALWLWQDEHGWISREGMQTIASLLGIPFSHVVGVVTFYTMYTTKPGGRHKIEVCTNVSCMLRNSDRILKHIEQSLHIKVGDTTADNRFTLVEAECLGSCGTAPMMQIGDAYHENLDEDKVDRILSELK